MSEIQMKTYDWDDDIVEDGGESLESVLLPEGNYPFEVVKVEKTWYDGSKTIPPCNMAKVFLRVDGGERGKGLVVENLYLCERMIWKVSAFFRSIGMKKHGEPVNARQFDHCQGEHGRCQIFVDTYTTQNGEQRQNNKLRRFFDPEEAGPQRAFKKGAF